MKETSILFLLPYPLGRAPSQRFRVEQYFPLLDERGITYDVAPFLDEHTWDVLYQGKRKRDKILGTIRGFRNRYKLLKEKVAQYEIVFIHREAAPLGPPIFERWLAKHSKAKIIYDFDDAIWIPNISAENKGFAFLKNSSKVAEICSLSHVVIGGNDYLCNYAKQFSKGTVVKIPTVVDTEKRYTALHEENGNLVVGWTGSHSTIKYLDLVVPHIKELQKKFPFKFVVIADKEPNLEMENFEFIPWQADREISDLQRLDIGLMPLERDAWSEGKCGFKLIQYLALGIPAVASDVGVNNQIVEEGVNGFLIHQPKDWVEKLTALLHDASLRKNMGAAGREKIIASYSINSQKESFLGLFSNL